MRRFYILGIIALIMGACTSTEKLSQNQTTREIVNDSTTHKIKFNDWQFDLWYTKFDDPATFRDIEYYQSLNSRYVRKWNARAVDHSKGYWIKPLIINVYEIKNLEVQHKLFHYFQFLEKVRGIRLDRGFYTRLTPYNTWN